MAVDLTFKHSFYVLCEKIEAIRICNILEIAAHYSSTCLLQTVILMPTISDAVWAPFPADRRCLLRPNVTQAHLFFRFNWSTFCGGLRSVRHWQDTRPETMPVWLQMPERRQPRLSLAFSWSDWLQFIACPTVDDSTSPRITAPTKPDELRLAPLYHRRWFAALLGRQTYESLALITMWLKWNTFAYLSLGPKINISYQFGIFGSLFRQFSLVSSIALHAKRRPDARWSRTSRLLRRRYRWCLLPGVVQSFRIGWIFKVTKMLINSNENLSTVAARFGKTHSHSVGTGKHRRRTKVKYWEVVRNHRSISNSPVLFGLAAV